MMVDGWGRWDEASAEAELLEAVRAGDPGAFEQLYVRHRDFAERLAGSLVPAVDVADVVAESFAQVFAALRRGAGPRENFGGYLRQTVRHMALAWLGKAQRTIGWADIAMIADACGEMEPAADEVFEAAQDARATSAMVRDVFAGLSERARLVLWLVDVQDMSLAEAGQRMQISTVAAGTAVHRARRELRQQYLSQAVASSRAAAELAAAHTASTASAGSAGSASAGGHVSDRELAQYAMNRLGGKRLRRVQAHLAACGLCSLALAEAKSAGCTLRAVGLAPVLAPLVLGHRVAPVVRVASGLLGKVLAGAAASVVAAGGIGAIAVFSTHSSSVPAARAATGHSTAEPVLRPAARSATGPTAPATRPAPAPARDVPPVASAPAASVAATTAGTSPSPSPSSASPAASPATSASSTPAQSSTPPASTAPAAPAPAGHVVAAWAPGSTLDALDIGQSATLGFTVTAQSQNRDHITLSFTLPGGLALAQPYPECTQDGPTLTCAAIGMHNGTLSGQLRVTATSPSPALPQITATQG